MKSTSVTRRILVVEDEPTIARVCLRALTGEGLEVEIAANGGAAEVMLDMRDYDLVLIDIRTPVMTGEELYRSITEKHPKLVSGVIFTTGDTVSGDTQSFLARTGRPFLPKPFTPSDLRAVVKESLRRLHG
jgi:DNA-binding response OmpR family regulator